MKKLLWNNYSFIFFIFMCSCTNNYSKPNTNKDLNFQDSVNISDSILEGKKNIADTAKKISTVQKKDSSIKKIIPHRAIGHEMPMPGMNIADKHYIDSVKRAKMKLQLQREKDAQH